MNICELPYVANTFAPARRKTIQVKVGNALIGGDAPILVQSMTTTKPKDIEGTVRETIALANAGCSLVRITVPTLSDAMALEPVMKQIRAAGCTVPVSADIHFQPKAAFEALKWVEKVRINPGNFVDTGVATLGGQTAESFEKGKSKVIEAFTPFVREAKRLGRAIRIGVNHGSLSARMLYRYGDTVEGMVESALEYIDVCEKEEFDQVVVSLKASNPRIAIEAYRMLAARLDFEGKKPYPFHVGVTEAGAGEDGRLKSAVGIGTLLLDGLGDTIRVSLTEDPVAEVPVARDLITQAEPEQIQIQSLKFNKDPYSFARSNSDALNFKGVLVGGTNPIRVSLPVFAQEASRSVEFISTESDYLQLKDLSDLQAFTEGNIPSDTVILYTGVNQVPAVRAIVATLHKFGKKNPVALYISSLPKEKTKKDSFKLKLSAELGSLLTDGIGDVIFANDAINSQEAMALAYDILQASLARKSKTEFISCPSCGRTLYDIQSVIGEIKARLGHLKDVSIAIMGCIVNGPGEMSGADFGYVGGAPGCITLYEGLVPVKKNIPQEHALDELVALLKARGRWVEP